MFALTKPVTCGVTSQLTGQDLTSAVVVWTVLASGGASYTVQRTVFDSAGTQYVAQSAVLDSSGTSYTPI